MPARARPSIWAYAGVGALVGLGVYTYNAYALFLPVVAVPFVYEIVAAPDRRARRGWLVRGTAVAATALWAAGLMIDYAARHEQYFWHYRGVSLMHPRPGRRATWNRRAGLVAARGAEWAKGVFRGGRPDDGDALGADRPSAARPAHRAWRR